MVTIIKHVMRDYWVYEMQDIINWMNLKQQNEYTKYSINKWFLRMLFLCWQGFHKVFRGLFGTW